MSTTSQPSQYKGSRTFWHVRENTVYGSHTTAVKLTPGVIRRWVSRLVCVCVLRCGGRAARAGSMWMVFTCTSSQLVCAGNSARKTTHSSTEAACPHTPAPFLPPFLLIHHLWACPFSSFSYSTVGSLFSSSGQSLLSHCIRKSWSWFTLIMKDTKNDYILLNNCIRIENL